MWHYLATSGDTDNNNREAHAVGGIQTNELKVGARNRTIILNAAEKVFATYGLKGASVQQIADEAGLPKTNVLYYFNSKKALYETVLRETLAVWNSVFDKATPQDDPALTLAEYIREKMEMSRTQPHASKIFAMEILNGAENLGTFFEEEQVSWMNSRKAVIQSWVDQGKMQPVNPEYLLYAIWASTQHYADFAAQISRLHGRKMLKADFAEATANVITLILGGVGLGVPRAYRLASN